MRSLKDEDLKTVLDDAAWVFPDGSSIVMALRLRGLNTVKVSGVELWIEMIRTAPLERRKVALLGGSQYVVAEVENRLQNEEPHVEIVYSRNGYFPEIEISEIIDRISNTAPKLIFVALGSPKQEKIIKQLCESTNAIILGVGGSFDVYAGVKKRAPKLFLKLQLEWLHRLLVDMSMQRLRRQLSALKFLPYLLLGKY